MKTPRFLKAFVILNGLVPAALLLWDAWHGRLGADPVNFAIKTTGLLALIFLLLSLFVTPLNRIRWFNALGVTRRALGLFAFFYTLGHFSIFFWWDRGHSVSATWTEIWSRNYLRIGFTALLLMTPLALTSTDGMIRLLGPKRWKYLHKLAYLAALGGAVHYYMQVKSDTTQPLIFGGVLAALLLYRWVYNLIKAEPKRAPAIKSPVKTPPSTAAKPQPAAAPVRPAKPKFWKGDLKVARVFDETPDVRTFRLVPTKGEDLPFDYMPGQYLNLMLDIDGQRVNRSYTIASSPTRAGYCELTIKRDGTASKFLHEKVRAGDTLNVSAPAGRFTFDPADGDSLVMIAGGVGITPLMTKIRFLTDTNWPGQLHLIFVARSELDLIFREEIGYLLKRHRNLHVTTTLTRPEESWPGRRGRLTSELLREVVPSFATHVFHLCGPGEMLESTKALLNELGVPESQIRFESFASPNRPDPTNVPAEEHAAKPDQAVAVDDPDSTDDAPAVAPDDGPAHAASDRAVTFAQSGKTVPITNGQTILEAAESVGVDIPYDCRSGTCGTCKIHLTSGDVSMDVQDALTKQDVADGIILACQAHPQNAVTIDA